MSPRSMREDDDALLSVVDESDGIVAEESVKDSAEELDLGQHERGGEEQQQCVDRCFPT